MTEPLEEVQLRLAVQRAVEAEWSIYRILGVVMEEWENRHPPEQPPPE